MKKCINNKLKLIIRIIIMLSFCYPKNSGHIELTNSDNSVLSYSFVMPLATIR